MYFRVSGFFPAGLAVGLIRAFVVLELREQLLDFRFTHANPELGRSERRLRVIAAPAWQFHLRPLTRAMSLVSRPQWNQFTHRCVVNFLGLSPQCLVEPSY